ncbi:hypothetical protein I3J27_18325 [Bradyrhizobium xenonodulans]|uniref:Uncharacterized protein n=1 Tax=Bradyrhizobium xenonodulans TaxID=2736875 RepID=A0ABY7MVS0_9BRAD|nr:hypothetical protein [Bradyrhizobium xenonodulans]WBL82289.1 hypothetical protein I3J27_18325 [Bradyrhizobium xenonodulans]
MDILKTRPEPQDFEEIERRYGKPETDAERAQHYRLAQANVLIRLYRK